MAYFEKYVCALEFLLELDPETTRKGADIEKARDYLLSCQSDDLAPTYARLAESIIRPLAKSYLRVAQKTDRTVARACHAIADGFFRTYTHGPALAEKSQQFPMAITIGAVLYKGERIYHVDRDSLRAIIKRGRRRNEDLPVHVWLTLENMMVVDLTIASYLRGHGQVINEPGVDESGVLIWHEDNESSFSFEPVLVNNNFFDLIDIDVSPLSPREPFVQAILDEGGLPVPSKTGRNALCPCGSGKKYKRCCGTSN